MRKSRTPHLRRADLGDAKGAAILNGYGVVVSTGLADSLAWLDHVHRHNGLEHTDILLPPSRSFSVVRKSSIRKTNYDMLVTGYSWSMFDVVMTIGLRAQCIRMIYQRVQRYSCLSKVLTSKRIATPVFFTDTKSWDSVSTAVKEVQRVLASKIRVWTRSGENERT